MLVLLHTRRQINLDKLVDLVKGSIRPEQIEKYLPFAVIRKDSRDGEYQHLILNSVIPVTTEHRIVLDGEPLCQRWDDDYKKASGEKELCPGCFAIAKAVAFAGGDREVSA